MDLKKPFTSTSRTFLGNSEPNGSLAPQHLPPQKELRLMSKSRYAVIQVKQCKSVGKAQSTELGLSGGRPDPWDAQNIVGAPLLDAETEDKRL